MGNSLSRAAYNEGMMAELALEVESLSQNEGGRVRDDEHDAELSPDYNQVHKPVGNSVVRSRDIAIDSTDTCQEHACRSSFSNCRRVLVLVECRRHVIHVCNGDDDLCRRVAKGRRRPVTHLDIVEAKARM